MKRLITASILAVLVVALALGVKQSVSPATVSAQPPTFEIVYKDSDPGQDPFLDPPENAVGWFVENDEIGHIDASFGIPGRDNPKRFIRVDPKTPNEAPGASPDAGWGKGASCREGGDDGCFSHGG